MRKLLLFVMLGMTSVKAETIYTFWNSDPADYAQLYAMGWGRNYRIAQVFTAPSTDTILNSFAFQAWGNDTAQFTATLWKWNVIADQPQNQVNASNWEWWGVLNHGQLGHFQKFTFSGFEYQLNAGESYALVFQGYGALNWISWLNPSMSAIGHVAATVDPDLYPFSHYGDMQSLTQLTFIPEPSSFSLLVLGGVVVALGRRKR